MFSSVTRFWSQERISALEDFLECPSDPKYELMHSRQMSI